MTTADAIASAIVAIDLGKYKSVACEVLAASRLGGSIPSARGGPAVSFAELDSKVVTAA